MHGALYKSASLLFFLLLVTSLLSPHPVGMADNGDYIKSMREVGIAHMPHLHHWELLFNYLRVDYLSTDASFFPQTLTQLFIILSKGINRLFCSDGHYSIISLSILYILLYTILFYLFIRYALDGIASTLWLQILFVALSLYLLKDIAFTAYFNSFYNESISILASLAFVVALLKRNVAPPLLLLSLLLLSFAKVQNITLLLLLPLLIYLYSPKIEKRLIAATLLVLVVVFSLNPKAEQESKIPNIYNSLFYGLLKNATPQEAEEILRSIPLEPSDYMEFVGSGYWPHGGEKLQKRSDAYKRLFAQVDHARIIRLYLQHPALLMRNITYGINYLMLNSIQPNYLGNFTQEASKIKVVATTLLGSIVAKLYVFVYIIALLFSLLLLKYRDRSEMTPLHRALLSLTFILPFIFGTNMVGDGFFEFIRHSLTFYYLIVLLFLVEFLALLEYFSPKPLAQNHSY